MQQSDNTKSLVKQALVDNRCNIKGELLEFENKIYNCILNQTDIKQNSNKFYIMQIIVSSSNKYYLFIVYGRTGETGKSSIKEYDNQVSIIYAFEKQYKTKTGNDWHSKTFTKKAGKYYMTDIDYEAEFKKLAPDIADKIKQIEPPSKLSIDVQDLIGLLSDVSMMQESMVSLDIDTKKMPLGKLSHNQLEKADQVLNKLEHLIATKNNNLVSEDGIVELSSEYYTYLPMACGRKTPPLIDNSTILDNYRNIINELKNIVIAVRIKENSKIGDNKIDSIYDGINTNIDVLDKSNPMYNEILQYINNTQGKTHHCNVDVVNIFQIQQHNKTNTDITPKMLLFHGSALTNWLSILKHDLLINPTAVKNNVVVTGKMFGNGIYFANCVSKSWNYCRSYSSKGYACLALAEVAVGNMLELTNSYNVTQEYLDEQKCHSTYGIGRYTPATNIVINDIIIPNGKLDERKYDTLQSKTQMLVNNHGLNLLYDEFIVYKSEQQVIKYLVIIKDKNI